MPQKGPPSPGGEAGCTEDGTRGDGDRPFFMMHGGGFVMDEWVVRVEVWMRVLAWLVMRLPACLELMPRVVAVLVRRQPWHDVSDENRDQVGQRRSCVPSLRKSRADHTSVGRHARLSGGHLTPRLHPSEVNFGQVVGVESRQQD